MVYSSHVAKYGLVENLKLASLLRVSTGTGTGTIMGRNNVASFRPANVFLFLSRTMRTILHVK